jgi:hypothetical protein
MKLFIRANAAVIFALALACATGAYGQKADPNSKDLNIRAYIELLRTDLRGKKVAVVSEVMGLTEDEAVKFWPIYKEYQDQSAKLVDQKLAGIKNYADNFQGMTEDKAKELTQLALRLEADRVALKTRYIDKMSAALSPKLAARFLQVENQIQFLMDLQIASSLPVIQ